MPHRRRTSRRYPSRRFPSRRLPSRRLPAIALIALVVLVLGAASAVAATIDVNPSTVSTGGQVTVSGDVLANGQPGCTVPGDVTLISPAFDGLGEFAGVGATTATADASGNFTTTVTLSSNVAPGSYTVTGRCGGGDLGVSASLTVAPTPVTIPPHLTG
jgi:hypothetical protein